MQPKVSTSTHTPRKPTGEGHVVCPSTDGDSHNTDGYHSSRSQFGARQESTLATIDPPERVSFADSARIDHMLTRRWIAMTWRDGLFLHWPVDPDIVAQRLPDQLTVATYDGDAYLSVVAFVMDDIRPRGVPFGLSFPELNLRTYVDGPVGPGVFFYTLDADDRLGVSLARRLFALPYYRAEMEVHREHGAVQFTSRRAHSGARSARFDATYEPKRATDPQPAASGSLDAFLLENYRFYADGDDLYYGTIDHEPWRLREATATIRTNTLFEANQFDRPSGSPLIQYAEPIAVSADRIRRCG